MELADILEAHGCKGYTMWNEITGRGSETGEPHHGTHAWPTLNNAMFSVVPDEKVDGILDGLVYSEGMHSPIHLRPKDSGRHYVDRYDAERETQTERHMLSPACRVPLWHLTYHDCLISFPYWGDSTASSHRLVRQRILFACLYGCPPLYSFSARDFEAVREDVVESYHVIRTVTEKVALLPMTDFEILSEDDMLQRTVFGDKYEVIVNFSEQPRKYRELTLAPQDVVFRSI